MAIEVGDAVLKFLGDSTQLDTKFAEVQPNAQQAFSGAADAVEEGTGRMRSSMYEARGEARLLGEEFGVTLPRHVSNFLAELPGVGQALSAAFSATAVLFLAGAVVQVTKKVTDFATANFVYTKAQKESEQAAAETNKTLIALGESYKTAKDDLDHFGASGTDALRLQRQALQQQIATVRASFNEGQKNIDQSKQQTHEYIQQTGWVSKVYDKVHSIVTGTNTQVESLKAATTAAQEKYTVDSATLKTLMEQQALLDKQLETEDKLEAIRQGGDTKAAGAKLRAAQKDAEVQEDSQTGEKRKQIAEQLEDELYTIKRDGLRKQLALLKENDANTKDAQLKILSELKVAADQQATVVIERMTKLKDEVHSLLQEVSVAGRGITFPPIITVGNLTNLQLGRDAAHNMGVTLKEDLVKQLNDAIKAQRDFEASGLKDSVALAELQKHTHDAQAALDAYGKTIDTFKLKSHGMWDEFQRESKSGASALDLVKQSGVDAFDDLSKNIEGAFASIVLGQGNVVQALEKATAASLAQIASQAAVKALFYTAEGTASLFTDPTAAGGYFTAAAEMAAVAALAGVAGRELSGAAGGSGSSSTAQTHNSVSNTGQSNRSGGSTVGVQAFAEGGLITAPTLAVVGEGSKREAVLPLDDPQSMATIGKALAQNGATHHHWHIDGMISPDNLAKVVKSISKMVDRGQVNLTASNSLRLTKRSA